jgi:hypothetical protein
MQVKTNEKESVVAGTTDDAVAAKERARKSFEEDNLEMTRQSDAEPVSGALRQLFADNPFGTTADKGTAQDSKLFPATAITHKR